MPADDPYRTLGLERTASLDEVKRAYRRLVKRESGAEVNARIFQPSILPPAEAHERSILADQVALEV